MFPYDPDQEDAATYTPSAARAWSELRSKIPVRPFEVLAVSTWVMTAQVAERYRDRRILLVGDAAHRFPPTGGLGLNTGVADAHNLAWKLASVVHGTATPELVETYETERRPVAVRNAAASLANALQLIEVPAALGADDDPEVFAANMAARLADPSARAEIEAAIANQAAHFDLLGLQLGYTYRLGSPDPAVEPERRAHLRPVQPARRTAPPWLGPTQRPDLFDAGPHPPRPSRGTRWPVVQGTRGRPAGRRRHRGRRRVVAPGPGPPGRRVDLRAPGPAHRVQASSGATWAVSRR